MCGILLVACACRRTADAQVTRDSVAPVRCFQLVTAAGLASETAVDLCGGMPSDAPGRCYVQSIDRFHQLSTQQVQQLCTAATSLQPVECYARLDARGDLTEDQAIQYCATRCPIGPPPPEASSAACLDAAASLSNLALQTAAELCLGSTSEGPVRCFLAGEDLHSLSESSLVQLCAETSGCQYYNAIPASY